MKNKLLIIALVLVSMFGQVNGQNYALDFDGADDKVGVMDSPELNPLSEMTLEAWINAEEWQSSIWAGVIMSKQGTSPDKGWCLSGGENGRVEFTVSIEETWASVATPQILGTNAWYHVAGVYTGSQLKIYVNGLLQNEIDVEGDLTPGDGVVVNIGDNPTWTGRFWTGRLDEIRIWEIARTQEEIQSNMSNELTGNEDGLVAYYPMNEGTGNATSDVSGNDNDGTLLNMDEAAWVDGFIPVTADVGVQGIASPSEIGTGFTANEKVRIEVKNYATEPVTDFEVSYQINGGEVVTETINVEIGPFETYLHTFTNTVNLAGEDEINIIANTILSGDSNPENDEIEETISQTTNFMVFDQERHNYGGYGQTHTHTVYMPESLGEFSQILLHIDLECPTGGCDPWDQPALVNIVKDGETYELARYITPYGIACGGWTWDITDFRSLLVDEVDWISYVQVWGSSGWLVSIELELIEGTPEYPYVKIEKLWAENNWVYGDPDVSYDFPEQTIGVHEDTEAAKIRMTMTGHGQGNTLNAAEFSEFTHHIHIDGVQTFNQHLWKDDCDDNECSNQNGTWLYSRAGWCPGQDVQPWEWNMEGFYTPGQDVNVDFVLADYTNLLNTGYNSGSHTEPHYRCHAYFVQYSHDNIIGVDDIVSTDAMVKVFPNPNEGAMTLESDHLIHAVEVYNLNGQLISRVNHVNSFNYQLNIESEINGLYMVKVISENTTSMVKVIKK
jgi:hypothetical protein